MFSSRLSRAGALAGALTLLAGPMSATAGASAHAHAKAHASQVNGAVVATNASRDTLVVASRAHLVTLRVNATTAAHTSLGTRVHARVIRLADGTDRVVSLRTGHATRRAHFRAVVVSSTSTTLSVSGGGSVVTMSSLGAHSRHAHNNSGSGTNPGTGAIVNVNAGFSAQGLDEITVIPAGSTALITLQGTVGTPGTGTLPITLESGETISVIVPSSITLPTSLASGQQVELLVSYDPSASTFTLVTISIDGMAGTQGVNQPSSDSVFDVEGMVTAYTAASGTTAGSITIQPGEGGSPVTLVVPSTVTVPSTVQLNTYVHAQATMVVSGSTSTPTLVAIRSSEGDHGQSGLVQIEGIVTSNDGTTLVVQTNQGDHGDGHSAPQVSISIPTTLATLAGTAMVGYRVHVRATQSTCTAVGTQPGTLCLTLVSLRVQHPEGGQGNQGNQNNQGDQGDQGDGSGTTTTTTPPSTQQLTGTVVSFAPATSSVNGSLVIQPSTGSPVTIVVPTTLNTVLLSPTEQVSVTVTQSNSSLVLTSAPTVQLSGTVLSFTAVTPAVGSTPAVDGTLVLVMANNVQATIDVPSSMSTLSVTLNTTVTATVTQTVTGFTLVQLS